MNNENLNEVKVYEKVDGKYNQVTIEYFYSIPLAEILNKDMILKLNDCFFCSNNAIIERYLTENKDAKHFNTVFDVYKKKLIAAGMSEQQDILEFTLSYIKMLLCATNTVGAKIENNVSYTDDTDKIKEQMAAEEDVSQNKNKIVWPK